jgi:hypothetical protein
MVSILVPLRIAYLQVDIVLLTQMELELELVSKFFMRILDKCVF